MEPILTPSRGRFVVYPIRHSDLWDFYKKQEASFWTAEEIDLQQDVADWQRLNPSEQHFLKHVLAFFAASDGIVNENLCYRFVSEVQYPEARAAYTFQAAMETIHAETYSLLIDTYIKDPDEKDTLLRAIDTVPSVGRKADWAERWISSDRPFAERLAAFACVEGIHFSGSFCAIYWVKHRGLGMPGLTFANELIARDEATHTDFALHLIRHHIQSKPSVETIHQIVREAVEIETEFCTESLPVTLIGMDSQKMALYIQFVADRLLSDMGYPKLYGASNPFPWMEMLGLEGKTNFFERRVSEYSKASVGRSQELSWGEDF